MLSILVWSLLWDRIQTSLTLNFSWWGSPCPSQTPSPLQSTFSSSMITWETGGRSLQDCSPTTTHYPPRSTIRWYVLAFPSTSPQDLSSQGGPNGPTQGCSVPNAWPTWILAASGYLLPPGQDSNTNAEFGVSCSFSSVTRGRGAGTRSGSM